MGAWSHEPFGNDTACDWSYELLESNDLSHIEATLDKILKVSGEYVEAPDGEEALAAVEVLAKLLGRGTQNDAYTEDIDTWVKKREVNPTLELLKKAQAVLARIVAKDSELAELWKESGDTEWRANVARLQKAIGA